VNIGYTQGLANTIRERGTNLIGQPVNLESTLSEDSVELGLTWRF
jgi:long-chain fatty acid transport protein